MAAAFALYRLVIDLGASKRTVVLPLPTEPAPRPGDVVELPNGVRCRIRQVVPAREGDTVAAHIHADLEQ